MVERKLPEPNRVKELYWDEELTQREIADEYDCTPGAVRQYMDRHGIEAREPHRRGEDHSRYVPDSALLDEAIAGYLIMHKWPSTNEFGSFSEYSTFPVYDRWASWNDFLQDAKHRLENSDEWVEIRDEVTEAVEVEA